MNTRDSNSQRMARNVKEVLHQYEPVWKEKPRVAKEVNTFDSAVEKMEPHAIGSLIVTKGFTDNKDAVALEMYTEAAAIARRVSIYALDTGDYGLHDQLRVSRGSLVNMGEETAYHKVEDIYNRVLPLVPSLADYDVDETKMTGLKTLMASYKALTDKPRNLTLERKRHNQTIPEVRKEQRQSLYKLDSLMTMFAGTDFYRDYKNARIIIDRGGSPKEEEKK